MDIFQNVPGIPGLFMVGIFSAALSSLSTVLNSLSAIVLEDFVKPFRSTPLTNVQKGFIMKAVIICCGLSSIALVFVVQKLGTVLQLSFQLHGVVTGPLLAVFVMGFVVPWINEKSAFFGGICGIVLMVWISLNNYQKTLSGDYYITEKPVNVDGCLYDHSGVVDNSTFVESTA